MVSGVHSTYAGYPISAGKPVTNNAKTTEQAQLYSGITTVSWADVMAGTAPSGSFVICKTPEERTAMRACLANGASRNFGLSNQEDYKSAADLSTVLTDEEWKSLNQKYDPSNMTQREYSALLTELHDKGLLSDGDLHILSVCEDGHSSCINVGGIHLSPVSPELMDGHCITSLTNNSAFPNGQPVGFSSGNAHCNVFDMSAWEKTFQYYDQDRSEWLPTCKAQAFQWLDTILQEMVSHK